MISFIAWYIEELFDSFIEIKDKFLYFVSYLVSYYSSFIFKVDLYLVFYV